MTSSALPSRRYWILAPCEINVGHLIWEPLISDINRPERYNLSSLFIGLPVSAYSFAKDGRLLESGNEPWTLAESFLPAVLIIKLPWFSLMNTSPTVTMWLGSSCTVSPGFSPSLAAHALNKSQEQKATTTEKKQQKQSIKNTKTSSNEASLHRSSVSLLVRWDKHIKYNYWHDSRGISE